VFPEADRALALAAVYGFAAAGLAGTQALFAAADFAVGLVRRAWRATVLSFAPRCPDCGGRGWRRWKDGDGSPVKGWTDCRLCRGIGRIVD